MNVPVKNPGCWCRGACPHLAKMRAAEKLPGKLAAVETAAKRVLTDAPDCPEAHRVLAHVYGSNNRPQLAGVHLAAARAILGETPAVALATAINLRNQAKITGAIDAAFHAVDLAPDNLHARIALAVALEADGQLVAAGKVLENAYVRFPDQTPMLRGIDAKVTAAGGDYAAAVDKLAGDDLSPVELFDRGRYREKLGDYAGAWSDWMNGKRIQRDVEKLHYDHARMVRRFDLLRDMAQPHRFDRLRGCAMPDARPWPLFITGFPRSGTTMVEAALSAHPRVAAGDELMFIPELLERLPAFLNARARYPRALMATAWPENETVLPLLQQFYIGKALQKIGAEAWTNDPVPAAAHWPPAAAPAFFTDKMPSNELHYPFLSLLFPGAPLIHCRRHPLDILVSCMSNYLVHGAFNAVDLEWCARHYALTDELVDHYREKVSLPMLLEVRYETFVADHKAGVDAILAHCGLEPAPACYDFHLSEWHSRTLSYRQVKEPAHARSVGRYKPFLEFLRPIVPILQPTLDREGYEL